MALRNRGDGTFEAYPGFPAVHQVREFVWADLDADGDPDAALLDAAGLPQVFLNQRSQIPQFVPSLLPDVLGAAQAMAAADLDRDATLDLILLGNDGGVRRRSLDEDGWHVDAVTRWPDFSPAGVAVTMLLIADLDNNGDLDLVASNPAGGRVWLATASGLQARPAEIADIHIIRHQRFSVGQVIGRADDHIGSGAGFWEEDQYARVTDQAIQRLRHQARLGFRDAQFFQDTMPLSAAFAERADRSAARRILRGICKE